MARIGLLNRLKNSAGCQLLGPTTAPLCALSKHAHLAAKFYLSIGQMSQLQMHLTFINIDNRPKLSRAAAFPIGRWLGAASRAVPRLMDRLDGVDHPRYCKTSMSIAALTAALGEADQETDRFPLRSPALPHGRER
jgi:hypothetical protein